MGADLWYQGERFDDPYSGWSLFHLLLKLRNLEPIWELPQIDAGLSGKIIAFEDVEDYLRDLSQVDRFTPEELEQNSKLFHGIQISNYRQLAVTFNNRLFKLIHFLDQALADAEDNPEDEGIHLSY